MKPFIGQKNQTHVNPTLIRNRIHLNLGSTICYLSHVGNVKIGCIGIFEEAATGGVVWKKVFLKISQNSQENICVGVFFLIILKETPTKVFSSEFWKIFKNNLFIKHFRWLLLY